MDVPTGDAKARILAATLRIIDASGAASVTVRRVAADARVNVAAVNYHFGNKEGLIRQALQSLMGSFFAAFDLLNGQDDPKIRLKAFLKAYIASALRYPDIVRSVIGLTAGQDMAGGRMEAQAADEYERFARTAGMERVADVVGQISGRTYRPDLAIMTMQMMSSLTVPLLAGQAVRRVTGIDLVDPEMRDRYIDLLVDRL